MNKITKALLTFSGAVLLNFTPANAQIVYDLQDSLAGASSPIPNPVNSFSFGQYTNGLDNTSFIQYTTFDENLLGTGVDAFYTNPYDPNIIYNDTGSTFTSFSFNLPAGELSLGPASGPSVVRFTIPITGYYQISAEFAPAQTAGSAFMYVYYNSTQLAANTSNPSFSYSSGTPLTLTAGDTIDFVVGGPGSGNNATSLAATLTAVPEPSTVAFLTLAIAVVLVRTIRQRGKGLSVA